MKKYLETFRLSFKMQIIWRFDVAMTVLGTICRILAAWLLWGAIFGERTDVSGFTFDSMLSYYVVSSFISSIDKSGDISGEVSQLIRDGGFSKHIAVPMDPLGFFGAMTAGQAAFHLGFGLATAAVCTLLFNINIAFTADIMMITAAVAMVLMGIVFLICFQYMLGIISFIFLSVGGLNHFFGSVTAFATGAMIPLALLPEGVRAFLRLLPFYYANYLPAMLLTGRGADEMRAGLLVMSAWTAGMLFVARVSYNKMRVRYDGVGI